MNKPILHKDERIDIFKYKRPLMHHGMRYKWEAYFMSNAKIQIEEGYAFTYVGAKHAAYKIFRKRDLEFDELYHDSVLFKRIEDLNPGE